jgi:hypothetical protein
MIVTYNHNDSMNIWPVLHKYHKLRSKGMLTSELYLTIVRMIVIYDRKTFIVQATGACDTIQTPITLISGLGEA